MSAESMLPFAPTHYDPVAVFVEVLADLDMAVDLAEAFTCSEVNALVAFLDHFGMSAQASVWLGHHTQQCSDPKAH